MNTSEDFSLEDIKWVGQLTGTGSPLLKNMKTKCICDRDMWRNPPTKGGAPGRKGRARPDTFINTCSGLSKCSVPLHTEGFLST